MTISDDRIEHLYAIKLITKIEELTDTDCKANDKITLIKSYIDKWREK